MKRFRRLAAAGLMITMMGSAALASTGSLTEFKPQVMPVLVHVDSQGKVTDVSPSTHLSPALSKQLAESLDGWINHPGLASGRPVDTAMIVNVALKTEPRADGNYDMKFVYVSSSESPFHSAHWASINGHQLALVDNTGSVELHDSPKGMYVSGTGNGITHIEPASHTQPGNTGYSQAGIRTASGATPPANSPASGH